MGVKVLWEILDPVGENYTLADLHGKCLAVDISGWIFQSKEAQQLTGKDGIRPHLRNLFWRLYHLTLNQVQIVVVFDGPCPDLKTEAVRRRVNSSPAKDGESKFKIWAEDCKEMLSVFKIPFIVSDGDAEATCAHLNQDGLVDGCVTEDSDAFLFGANAVYRHFSCDNKKANNLLCYKMETIKEMLKLSRDHLISLALLLGCDYGVGGGGGVKGIGKEHAVKLMKSWQNLDPLNKMEEWKSEKRNKNQTMEYDVTKKPKHCRRCGHSGSGIFHVSSGCFDCGMSKGCNKTEIDSVERNCSCEYHKMSVLRQRGQLETKIRDAALRDPSFPNREVINMYRLPDTSNNNYALEWSRPSYEVIEKYLTKVFKWNPKDIQKKMAVYFTAYDMCAMARGRVSGDSYPAGMSRPDKIVSKRKQNFRETYAVRWKTIPGVPVATGDVITTREFKEIFSAAYPQVAAKYEGWLLESSTPVQTPSRKRNLSSKSETPQQGKQATMERYCVARKKLNFGGTTPSRTVAASVCGGGLDSHLACQID